MSWNLFCGLGPEVLLKNFITVLKVTQMTEYVLAYWTYYTESLSQADF